MDVNGILLSHELPMSNDSDGNIAKRYEPEEFDFLTMSVGNEEQPREFGSVDEFIDNNLNESMRNASEATLAEETFSELVGNSPRNEELNSAKKRKKQVKSPKENVQPVKKRRRSSIDSSPHPKPILVEENFREYKLPFGWIKTAHRRKGGKIQFLSIL